MALCVSLLLASCVPAPLGAYWQPLYPAGTPTYSGDLCHGAAGAPVAMRVALARGVTLSVRSGAAGHGSVQATVALSIDRGVRLRFVGDTIAVRDGDGERRVSAPTLHVFATRRIAPAFDLDRDSPTPELFARAPARAARFRSVASINALLPAFAPQAIEVEWPGMRIEDASGARLVNPLTVRAQSVRLRGLLVYRTNEMAAAVQERHAQCLRDPMRTAQQCERIPQYDERALDVVHGGLRYGGRWYVFDAASPFTGELTIEQDTPGSWRLAPPQVRVRDAALPDALARVLPIDRVSVTMTYDAPFSSQFIGAPAAAAADSVTRLEFVLTLDGDAARAHGERYLVQLPAVSIDGRTEPIGPIELIRHRLGAGLLPFNC